MRKNALIIAWLLVFAMLLAACAGGGDQEGAETGVPGTGEGTMEVIPETGATEGAGEGMETAAPTDAMGAVETATGEASPTSGATESATAESTPSAGATEDAGDATPTLESTEAAGTPAAGETPDAGSTPGAGQGAGVIGIPQTGSDGLVGLAAMMDWRVEGADGEEIGVVQDYVVNMCEAHILYLVVDPAEGVTADGGQQILIPFEAVLGELNEGSSLDVQQGVFTLKQNAADLSGAPGVDVATADMENPDWSEDVLDYWSANYRLSLTAGCNVPVSGSQGGTGQQATGTPEADTTPGAGTPEAGTPEAGMTPGATDAVTPTVVGTQEAGRQNVFRIALASKLLTADLQEGNGRVLGAVQDIAIVPETGRTQFVVVDAAETGQGAGRMVALPPGAVNVSYETGANQPVLVLLVETAVLNGAPEFDASNALNDQGWFDYWNQHIPMTREQLP